MAASPCRLCGAPLESVFADLGVSPLANSYIPGDQANAMEPFYPLRAFVCGACLLVQLEAYESPQAIFGDYAYFSSYSTTWLEHSRRYVDEVSARFGIDASKRVIEVASNDGYLLQYFHERGVPVLGIEPAANVARVALQKGIPTVVEFLGAETAELLAVDTPADLLIANNVLAHVPDLNDFIEGLRILLAPGGVLTIELQELLRLITGRHFDTIYHEHFSYLSLGSASAAMRRHGMRVFDVQPLPTHGGSLRLFICHEDDDRPEEPAVAEQLAAEDAAGLGDLSTYTAFNARVEAEKRTISTTLFGLKDEGLSIVGYGAPAKGNTLLNYCGIGRDILDYTVDLNPYKQGHLLPGSRIPIAPVERIDETRPDVIFILPWNLREEIMEQLAHVREWGCRFAVRSPDLVVV